MKLLTLNFLTCARKVCKQTSQAFPLHPQEAELEQVDLDLSPEFIRNILPRLEWGAMKSLSAEVGPLSFRQELPRSYSPKSRRNGEERVAQEGDDR